jgi:hypothetical protein
MSDGPIPYGIKAPGFDPTAGFRRELQKVEARRAQKESRALEMASMIEMADQSTMFGGDYSIANQWAEHLTENLDKYASSTEGMIKFQQQAQRLTKFIDGAEAYKKENFGSVKDGAQAGTFQGFVQRQALGENVYGDFEDGRDPQSYEMAYMGLNQPIQLNWDADDNPIFMDDGKPVSFDQYRRPDAPFMPKLKEGKILMGSTWYAAEGPNKSHETSTEAYEYSLAMTETDPRLERQAARFYQLNEKPNMKVDDIVSNPALMKEAREAWARDAEKSWINFREQKKTDDRTAKQKNQALDYQALIESIVPTSEIVAELPSMMTGEVAQFQEDKITFSPIAMTDKMDITPFLPESLKNVTIDNPNYDPATSSFDEKTITTPREVARTPGNIALTKEGQIILSGLGNIDDQSIGDIVIDPTTADGRIAMGKLSGMFREAYGVSFNQFLQAINAGFEVPETVVSGGDPLNLGL